MAILSSVRSSMRISRSLLCWGSLSVIAAISHAQGAAPEKQDGKTSAQDQKAVVRPDGYILVTPIASQETVLIAPDGSEKHMWRSEHQAAGGARLLPDGSILRIAAIAPAAPFRKPGVRGGRVQRIAWDGKVLWDFWNAATLHMVCGDALVMPNGNVLMSVIEHRSKEECIALGMDAAKVPKGMYAPGLMEFTPRGDKGGRLVWRWCLWDHVSQNRAEGMPNFDAKGEQRGRLGVHELPESGLVCAELDYDEASNLVLMTLPSTGEAWLLDRGTTLLEAKTDAGGTRKNGGAILWRWRSAPQEKEMQPSRVLSASFVRGQATGSSPKVRLLAHRGLEGKKTVIRVETVAPVLPSMPGLVSAAQETPEIVARWSEASPAQGGLPDTLLADGSSGWGVARLGSGIIEWHGQTTLPGAAWHYANARSPQKPAAFTLGKPPAQIRGFQQLAPVRPKAVGLPRFYPHDYLALSR